MFAIANFIGGKFDVFLGIAAVLRCYSFQPTSILALWILFKAIGIH